MGKPRVVVLGGGPAGVGAAYRLRSRDLAEVTVLEQQAVIGGNAGSFELNGSRVDYGSHRLHPACDADILSDVRTLLGDDLLDRPRHGRIRLRGKWIHFPLKPVDLMLRLDKRFALGTVGDMIGRRSKHNGDSPETFASVLQANLGSTICDNFYFPYARKIWGREPEELSAIQARRRVSAGSFTKLLKKVASQIPGFKPPGAGRFYYPRHGFGQITEAFGAEAERGGAEILTGWRVTNLEYNEPTGRWVVSASTGDTKREFEADFVWSTIPITILSRLVVPRAPAEVFEAGAQIAYRAMVLVYLEFNVDQFTEYDAHYFPGKDVSITRLSEPKNYAARQDPVGRTVICAELPCEADDENWTRSDDALGHLVIEDLQESGLSVPVPPLNVHVRRLRQAYPIYQNGYETPFSVLDRWVDGLPRLLSYGRQGLFAHDNTHHALYMAYAAADCLADGDFDRAKWLEYREQFKSHVVED